MNLSFVQPRGRVDFPEFTGERVYMQEFTKSGGLPDTLKRWQKTVDQMLHNVETDLPMFIMIDQAAVDRNKTHRRGGVHVDGYWHKASMGHRGDHGGGHMGGGVDFGHQGGWDNIDFSYPEATIFASDYSACIGFHGEWDGLPNDGGDCAHIDTSGMKKVEMLPGVVYAGNISMLHESIPVRQDVSRTLVRITVPGWSPELVH